MIAADEVRSIALSHLSKFPLFKENHAIPVVKLEKGWYLGYRTENQNRLEGTTHFEVNTEEDICYLLDIEVKEELRGKGYGASLYSIVETIAKDLGCSKLEQTPSGTTGTGETRASYLKRKGYTLDGIIAYKLLGKEHGTA